MKTQSQGKYPTGSSKKDIIHGTEAGYKKNVKVNFVRKHIEILQENIEIEINNVLQHSNS